MDDCLELFKLIVHGTSIYREDEYPIIGVIIMDHE